MLHICLVNLFQLHRYRTTICKFKSEFVTNMMYEISFLLRKKSKQIFIIWLFEQIILQYLDRYSKCRSWHDHPLEVIDLLFEIWLQCKTNSIDFERHFLKLFKEFSVEFEFWSILKLRMIIELQKVKIHIGFFSALLILYPPTSYFIL